MSGDRIRDLDFWDPDDGGEQIFLELDQTDGANPGSYKWAQFRIPQYVVARSPTIQQSLASLTFSGFISSGDFGQLNNKLGAWVIDLTDGSGSCVLPDYAFDGNSLLLPSVHLFTVVTNPSPGVNTFTINTPTNMLFDFVTDQQSNPGPSSKTLSAVGESMYVMATRNNAGSGANQGLYSVLSHSGAP